MSYLSNNGTTGHSLRKPRWYLRKDSLVLQGRRLTCYSGSMGLVLRGRWAWGLKECWSVVAEVIVRTPLWTTIRFGDDVNRQRKGPLLGVGDDGTVFFHCQASVNLVDSDKLRGSEVRCRHIHVWIRYLSFSIELMSLSASASRTRHPLRRARRRRAWAEARRSCLVRGIFYIGIACRGG